MKTLAAISLTVLSCLVLVSLVAAEKDAAGCKDHPLSPRLEGFYIAGCSSAPGNADFDLTKGGTVHVEGPSTALMYMPQPDRKEKPTEVKVKADFEAAMKKLGATLAATTPGQKWPAYTLQKDGKEYWVVLLVDSGEYFTGSYAVRVIERRPGK